MLRHYQEDTLAIIRSHVVAGKKRILVNAPTGFGKTILSKEIIRGAIKRGNSVLFTNHRIVLSEQSFSVFEEFNPNLVQGINVIDNGSKLTVGTIQSLSTKGVDLKYDIVIIDEVHYAYDSGLVQSILKANPNSIIIGLSATPYDPDGYLIDGFDAIVDKYQMKELIELGYLTPFSVHCPLDMSDKVDNDSIVSQYFSICKDKKFVAFCSSVIQCEELKEKFPVKTEIITATTPEKKRIKILSDLKSGKITGVLSIDILTTGFDEPSIECVILATKMGSLSKYKQSNGRGARKFDGKEFCYLLDFFGNVEFHGMPEDRVNIKFKTKFSRAIDRVLKLDDIDSEEKVKEISESKKVYLKKISSILDLYNDKVYTKESQLQEDVNRFMDKTGFFYWRQNSGRAFIEGRWVNFASKAGLPDNAVFYKRSSLYFGIELKLPKGVLTDHQRKTLPEMTRSRVLFFIAESVLDCFLIIEFIESNLIEYSGTTIIKHEIYDLFDRQIELRNKLKLPLYEQAN